MGKASREHRQAVIAGKETPYGGIKEKPHSIIDKMKTAAIGMTDKIKSQMGNEVIMGIPKLVKEDIKKGKVKDVEAYVLKCRESLRPGTNAGNMIINAHVTLDEVEALIRQTLKDNLGTK